MRLRPLFLALSVVLLDCASLDPLAANTCGNGVIDAVEDCDTFPNDTNARCGAPTAGAAKCRLLCGKQPDNTVLTCPDGWGCSVSGFCRQPTGSFDPGGDPVSAGVTTMLVGDFDGDGRKDVLGSSGANSKGRIHYFQDGAAPQVVPLPGTLASPVVYDFDGDGRSDIAFGYTFRGAVDIQDGTLELSAASGFAINLGQSDRAVVSKLFPTTTAAGFDALLVPLDTRPPNATPNTAGSSPVIAVATVKGSGGRTTLLRSLEGDPSDLSKGYLKVLPGSLDDLAGEPRFGQLLNKVARSTCGDLVVPFHIAAGARIQVYPLCNRVGPKLVDWSKEDPREIAIPGETLTRIFVADVDGDTFDDVIIGTTAASGKARVRIAYSNGTDFELVDAPGDMVDVPLAAGFIDLDRRIDFVLPSGVLLSSRGTIAVLVGDGGTDPDAGTPLPTPRGSLSWNNIPAPTKRWTVAQIADLNRDKVPDVIGASAYEPDIDVLEGTGTLAMPTFSIPTTGSVTNLAVGDLDFDGNDDIAFVQARPASTEREVAIAYGRALTMPPETPRPAGRLDGIRQVFVTSSGLTITSESPAPVAADLPTFSLAVLLASGDRQPIAPLLFDLGNAGAMLAPSTRRELVTRSLVAARSRTAVDLVALVSQTDYARSNGKRIADPQYGVWAAPGKGALAFDAPSAELPIAGLTPVDRGTDTFLIQLVAGDIDGDKLAELVAIAPDAAGTGAAMYIIHPAGAATALPTPLPIPGRTAPGGVRSQLLDIDGDGNVDLVAILRNAAKQLEVNVFFGDGRGQLAIPGVTLTLPVPAGAASSDFTSLGFAQITTAAGAFGTPGGKRRELAIVTPKHLFRAFMKTDRSIEVVESSTFGTINYGSAVVAGDFDGDGVEDLAIADQGSIRIARQQARLP